MKTKPILWMALSAALLLAIPFLGRGDDVPSAINYQGRLTDTLGNPLTSGYYEIEFRIWNDAVQNGEGNLVWGRSFPLHVVTNGLFNILLTDDGGQITTPTTPTNNTLLTAFGGPDRYLGLTITVSNGVTVGSPPEISPRQQLASAPFAVQAQTANGVVAGGITNTMLQSGSVTTPKIATSAVTTEKIADNAVTEAKIADNAVTTSLIKDQAVTSAKLNIDGDFHLNDHNVFLRGGSDTNHGVGWFGSGKTFAGNSVDGPVLFGYAGGVLGTTSGGQKAALSWDATGAVSLFGPPIDISSYIPSEGNTKSATAKVDGMLIFYAYSSNFEIQILKGGTTEVFNKGSQATGISIDAANDDAQGKFFTWPIRKGDKFTMYLSSRHNSALANQLYIVPFGLGVGASASDVVQ